MHVVDKCGEPVAVRLYTKFVLRLDQDHRSRPVNRSHVERDIILSVAMHVALCWWLRQRGVKELKGRLGGLKIVQIRRHAKLASLDFSCALAWSLKRGSYARHAEHHQNGEVQQAGIHVNFLCPACQHQKLEIQKYV